MNDCCLTYVLCSTNDTEYLLPNDEREQDRLGQYTPSPNVKAENYLI